MPSRESSFLPDFCAIRSVFATVLCAELLAFLFTLTGGAGWHGLLERLALNSLVLQWVALGCAGSLCVLRGRLATLGDPVAAAVALAVVLAVTAVVSEAALRVAALTGAPGEGVGRLEFLGRNLLVALLTGAFALRYLYLQHQWQRRLRSESEARIQALQARIRPHFLFNCMNTIASLTRSAPARAEQAVEDLSDLLRAALAEGRSRVALEEELELCRRYVAIESLRLGGRLALRWELGSLPAGVSLPPLSLQPLLENAINHGIEPLPEGGEVRVGAERARGCIRISVDNPMPPVSAAARPGQQLALRNLRERLALHFGDAARLQASVADGRYRVVLTLPLGENAHARAGG